MLLLYTLLLLDLRPHIYKIIIINKSVKIVYIRIFEYILVVIIFYFIYYTIILIAVMGEKCNGNCFCDFRNILIDCIEKLYFYKNKVFCLHILYGFLKSTSF